MQLMPTNDEKCVLLAVYSRMKGVARLWLDGSQGMFSTWLTFSNALIDEFGIKYDDINYIMCNASRKPIEKVVDHCFRMSAMGNRFNLSESAVIKYIRDGLKHREYQSSIAAFKFKTIKEMRETLEEFSKNMPSVSQNVSEYKKNYAKNAFPKPNKINDKTVTCYNCSEKGHVSNNCSKPQRRERCKYCNKVHPRSEPKNCGKRAAIMKTDCVNTKKNV